MADISTLKQWDEADHVQASSGDPNFNDWNWEYELGGRGEQPPWRHQLMAMLVDHEPKTSTDIGFVQVIDPLEEESQYWGKDCEPNLRAIDIWIGEADYIGKGY